MEGGRGGRGGEEASELNARGSQAPSPTLRTGAGTGTGLYVLSELSQWYRGINIFGMIDDGSLVKTRLERKGGYDSRAFALRYPRLCFVLFCFSILVSLMTLS